MPSRPLYKAPPPDASPMSAGPERASSSTPGEHEWPQNFACACRGARCVRDRARTLQSPIFSNDAPGAQDLTRRSARPCLLLGHFAQSRPSPSPASRTWHAGRWCTCCGPRRWRQPSMLRADDAREPRPERNGRFARSPVAEATWRTPRRLPRWPGWSVRCSREAALGDPNQAVLLDPLSTFSSNGRWKGTEAFGRPARERPESAHCMPRRRLALGE